MDFYAEFAPMMSTGAKLLLHKFDIRKCNFNIIIYNDSKFINKFESF
jgi:hypothetical protein